MSPTVKIANLVSPHTGPAPADVKKAIGYLRTALDRRITMAELTTACGVPERTLRKHFRRFVGLSPLDYFRRLRFAAVRNDLLECAREVSVTEVATRYGFTHFGRFASQYRRCFGESPSATLERARALAPGRAPFGIRLAGNRPSIAILPLQACATELKIRDFAESATEAIAVALGRSRSISVVLAEGSRSAKVERRLPRELGPRYLLAGRITQVIDRIRISLRLVDAGTGRHVWGDTYEGQPSDLFCLQDCLTAGVVRGILPNIRNDEIDRAQRKLPENLDAHGLTMRAFPLAVAANPEAARRALELLEHAMDLDPDFAFAQALAAWCHSQLVMHNGTHLPAEEKARALLLLRRASITDDQEPLTLTARCAVHTMAGELDVAEALIARVLTLDPTLAWAWERSAWQKTFAGEPEIAIGLFHRAIRLDASAPSSANRLVGLGSAHFHAGRYDQGAFWMRQALLSQPAITWVQRTLAVSYARLGDRANGLKSLAAFRRYNPDVTIGQVVASVPFPPDFLERLAEGLDDLGLPP